MGYLNWTRWQKGQIKGNLKKATENAYLLKSIWDILQVWKHQS